MAVADRQKFTAGAILILFGLGFFLLQRFEGIGTEVVLLIIGAAFLVGYFYQKVYGLLIPACILLGLGFGELLENRFWWANEGTQLGLGLGFVTIYVIARLYERQSHWWPLIPGVVLILVGLPRTARVFRVLLENWPLVLIAIGLLVLIGAFRKPRSSLAPAAAAETPEPGEPEEPEQPVEPRIE